MALSENEQRILDQIEQELSAHDPHLERRMRRAPHSIVHLITGMAIALVGLAIVLSSFTTGFPVAVFGVLATTAGLLVLFPPRRRR